MGLPRWGDPLWTGRMALDQLLWSAANLFLVHGSSFIRLFYDERHIDLPSEEHEMLWRYFYRHSGMSRSQFNALIVPHLKLEEFEIGDPIPCQEYLYMIIDGSVVADIVHEEAPDQPKRLRMASGDLFPLRHISQNFTPRIVVFHKTVIYNPSAESETCRAFSIPRKQLEAMATNHNARDAWSALLIATLAEVAEHQYADEEAILGDSSEFSSRGGFTTSVESSRSLSTMESGSSSFAKYHPLFGPLNRSEEPDPLAAGGGGGLSHPFQHLAMYLKLSVHMPWPWGDTAVGIRHHLPPPKEPKRHMRNTIWKVAIFEDKNYL
jgi:hypothetical protein